MGRWARGGWKGEAQRWDEYTESGWGWSLAEDPQPKVVSAALLGNFNTQIPYQAPSALSSPDSK